MNVVAHNIQAMNANRMLGVTTGGQAKSTEKLSSGYKINRAADDAAGLSISEKMRKQIRGLTQASANAQDGVSLCQIADGALTEVHDMLDRVKELAVKAANGTMSESDRADVQNEVEEIQKEIDRVHTTTKFNEHYIFSNTGINVNEIISGNNAAGYEELSLKFGETPVTIRTSYIGSSGKETSASNGVKKGANVSGDFADFVKQAATDAAKHLSTLYPNLFAKASTNGINIGLELGDIDGAGKTLAYAQLSFGYSSSETLMGYTMKIDTSDYDPSGFAEKKADLAATIAHEMTHLVMYDTLTKGMVQGTQASFPKWFKEGTAQTSSGDNGWVSYQLSPSASDAQIKNYMSQLQTMEYGAGYLAAMYLGYKASGSTELTRANIASGLDKIFTDVADGKLLSDAIKDNTSFSGLGDFENKFMNGSDDAVNFVKQLLTTRGTDGAGSLFGDLSQTEANLFSDTNLNQSYESYIIDPTAGNIEYRYNQGYDAPAAGSISRGEYENGSDVTLQVGADNSEDNTLTLHTYNISSKLLFQMDAGDGDGDSADDFALDVSTLEGARKGIEQVELASKRISYIRSDYGAMQNRLEHTIKNLDNVVENTTAAESLIRDTDMAKEMVQFSKNNILAQAGQSMLAQANQSNQGILSLLQ